MTAIKTLMEELNTGMKQVNDEILKVRGAPLLSLCLGLRGMASPTAESPILP